MIDTRNHVAEPDQTDGATARDDRNSDPAFVAYYEEESLSPGALARFRRVRDKMLRLAGERGTATTTLKVLNVGCGAGTECRVWAELGHSVTGIDISEPLIEIARKRVAEMGFKISFDVGSAIALPYESSVFDVCLIPQLLEHVPDWQKCLDEGVRVLRPGGLIYLSTTNVLCPIQDEFELPLYSWYPSFVKRRCEKLAVTTHREWVSHTDYPAVHWFTFWELRDFLAKKDIKCFDRFDLAEVNGMSATRGLAIKLIRRVPPIRVAAYFVVLGTILVGAKGFRLPDQE